MQLPILNAILFPPTDDDNDDGATGDGIITLDPRREKEGIYRAKKCILFP